MKLTSHFRKMRHFFNTFTKGYTIIACKVSTYVVISIYCLIIKELGIVHNNLSSK